MDSQSYEQLTMAHEQVADALQWVAESAEVEVLFVDERAGDIQVPSTVELEVTETEPGLRGDTVSGGGDKPATLASGASVRVPLFVDVGDRVKVDTRTSSYLSRA
jgi:elongation factor P